MTIIIITRRKIQAPPFAIINVSSFYTAIHISSRHIFKYYVYSSMLFLAILRKLFIKLLPLLYSVTCHILEYSICILSASEWIISRCIALYKLHKLLLWSPVLSWVRRSSKDNHVQFKWCYLSVRTSSSLPLAYNNSLEMPVSGDKTYHSS